MDHAAQKHVRVVSLVQVISCIALVPARSAHTGRCVKEPCRAELEGGVEKRALLTV